MQFTDFVHDDATANVDCWRGPISRFQVSGWVSGWVGGIASDNEMIMIWKRWERQ